MKNKTVLISGAGIAGLTLAYWLKRHGFVPTLVEKSPYPRTGGYKIDLRGVAIEILKQMNIYSAIIEHRTVIKRALCVDEKGNQVCQMNTDLLGTRLEGIDLEIMRGTLCLIMKEAIGEVDCLFGDFITHIEDTSQGVYVKFEKNAPCTFDIVIGADGLHSTVRTLVFGDESHYSREFGVFVSVFSIPNFLAENDCEIEHHSLRKFVNIYRDPKDDNAKAALAFSVDKPFYSRNPQEQKKLIEEAFANAGWKMPQILEAMKDSPDFYFDSMTQIHMPYWSKGHISLVGDAAYAATPMSGQGTSIAIVGAYILAGELADARGETEIAFPSYEKLLRPFAKQNQDLAKMSARIMSGSSYSVWLHQLGTMMPAKLIHYFKRLALKRTTKAANALTLKEYYGKNC